MTEVAFHFNAPDKWAYACRLLRKASHAGARVVVMVQPEDLPHLDSLLWTFAPLELSPIAAGRPRRKRCKPLVWCCVRHSPVSCWTPTTRCW